MRHSTTEFTKGLKKAIFSAFALGAVAFLANPAGAVTLSVGGTAATVECTATGVDPACLGLTGVGTTSMTTANLFSIGNSSPANEATFLNSLAGTSFATGTQLPTDPDSFSFLTTVEYFSIKVGNMHAFFSNEAFGLADLLVEFLRNGAQGTGLSHITTFGPGSTTVIPLPAALPLLLTAIGGLVLVGRRRRDGTATA